MKGKFLQFALGVLTGAALFGGASAAAAGIAAQPAWSPIFVDGQQVQMTDYNIAGNNYVKLRNIGKALGLRVSVKVTVTVFFPLLGRVTYCGPALSISYPDGPSVSVTA